jgi:hypothetical protein
MEKSLRIAPLADLLRDYYTVDDVRLVIRVDATLASYLIQDR